MIETLTIAVSGQGLHAITPQVAAVIERAEIDAGLCTLFIQHTSASLLIQENYDPTAADDLQRWFNRLVPESDPLYRHTMEGRDDMPAHIKSALTATSIAIPIISGRLALGSWQGIFVWEHRHAAQQRRIIIHMGA